MTGREPVSSRLFRSTLGLLLLLVVATCVYLSTAAKEAPRDSWWAFWYIYALIGLSSLVGAIWLLIPSRARH